LNEFTNPFPSPPKKDFQVKAREKAKKIILSQVNWREF